MLEHNAVLIILCMIGLRSIHISVKGIFLFNDTLSTFLMVIYGVGQYIVIRNKLDNMRIPVVSNFRLIFLTKNT